MKMILILLVFITVNLANVCCVSPSTFSNAGGAVAIAKGIIVTPSNPVNSTEWFWYPLDSGEAIPAWLVGGPKPVTFDDTERYVTFRLYRNGKTPGVEIRPDCLDTCLETYQRRAPLVVMAHGFGSNGRNLENSYVKNGFSNRSDLTLNVVLVDWESMASAPWYWRAVAHIEPVGRYTASLLNALMQGGYTSHDRIHYVGHSLGAQMGNYVAKYVEGGKISRITGLDPANPLFTNRNDSERIDPSDAQFVDVIHTSTRRLLGVNELAVGMREPRGHVDFYPNDGGRQPGCEQNFDDPLTGRCSHSRVHEYFAESIRNPRAFYGVPCDSYEEFDNTSCSCTPELNMGWATPTGTSGIYYLTTGTQSPYGLGNVCPFSSSQ